MKILVRALFLLFILIGVLIAVSNRQPVELALEPLPHLVVMPLYVVVIAVLLLGVLAGLGMGWWAGRHHRRRAREARGEAARLDREVQRLRQATATAPPASSGQSIGQGSGSGSGPAPRDQRAIRRRAGRARTVIVGPLFEGSGGPFFVRIFSAAGSTTRSTMWR